LQAPERVKEVAKREIERLATISPSSAEYTVARTYTEWILDLPWEVSTVDNINIANARQILDRDHYGLEDVKERILEFLAVRKLKGEGKGSILCFVGPPGVGKTSIGKSIAEAMGRKFVRMSLGGLRDEAEIRGHRRTYIGALPGRIIQNIRRAGTNNPVFMLDEIDKLGIDFRGDPASAMLEVLDPEQNNAFQDNYLELDFDLSRVLFITTANYLETIPPPLRDRMEILKLPGYITPEKVQIARRYLVPRQLKDNGLESYPLRFTEKALENIVVFYTREAGVRTLERTIGKVCRKIAIQVAEDGNKTQYIIHPRNLEKYLGPPIFQPDLKGKEPRIGVATGLAWTPVGGTLLQIEAIAMPGEGKLIITGRLGEVMRESAEIAMSYLRSCASEWGIPYEYFKKNDFHIHIPEGATPKDGPSAGITITTALASLFTKSPIRHDVAMTGEITLQGQVLPIGGLREKSVAAARAHIKLLICPVGNQSDLSEIPDIVKKKLEYRFVDNIRQVLDL
ncbi:MAG: endopeptidase La, partial [bacterium]